MPPRRTRNSDRPRASDRTMVATKSNRLPSFKNRRRCHHEKMKPRKRKSKPEQNLSSDRGQYLQTVGWISRQKTSRLPAEGEAFLLTSPFIEPPISKCDVFVPANTIFFRPVGKQCGKCGLADECQRPIRVEACPKSLLCPKSPFCKDAESLRNGLPERTLLAPQKELFVGIRVIQFALQAL
jgi:hypothetical protein